jgi:hypothetical protein
MKPHMKSRVKGALVGLGLFLAAVFLTPPIFCLFPGLCPGGFKFFGVELNLLGLLGIFFVGTWATLFVLGLGLVVLSLLKGEPLKLRYCPTCGGETNQFVSRTKFKETFKPKTSKDWKEYKANIISQEYTSNECGGKTLQPPVGSGENAEK